MCDQYAKQGFLTNTGLLKKKVHPTVRPSESSRGVPPQPIQASVRYNKVISGQSRCYGRYGQKTEPGTSLFGEASSQKATARKVFLAGRSVLGVITNNVQCSKQKPIRVSNDDGDEGKRESKRINTILDESSVGEKRGKRS